MKHFIITLFLFLFLLFAVSVAKADDIAIIRSFLDKKTDNAQVLHGVYMACLNLTRTGTEEAVPVLTQLLDDERFRTVARTALANIPIANTHSVPPLQQETSKTAPKTLTDAEEMSLLKQLIETANDKNSFRRLQRAVLELKSNQTGTIVLDNLDKFSPEQQSALVYNLGVRKNDADIVSRLMTLLAQSEQSELRLAAVQALGEIGDLRAVDTLLHLAGTPGEETADGRRQQRI
jgi:HEAT repeat protein